MHAAISLRLHSYYEMRSGALRCMRRRANKKGEVKVIIYPYVHTGNTIVLSYHHRDGGPLAVLGQLVRLETLVLTGLR